MKRYMARITSPLGETQTSKDYLLDAVTWMGESSIGVIFDTKSRRKDGGLCWMDGKLTKLGEKTLKD